MREAIEAFIARWQGREGGQERANYALFLGELASVLGLPPPDPAGARHEANDYVFERVVRETARDGTVSHKRIDLYKRDCFILEAKQSRFAGDKKLAEAPAEPTAGKTRGRRGADRAWDVLMLNARRQAEDYVRLLPPDHEPPPFVLVCDVGHCIEVYANFRRDGKAYDQFPDRGSFRIYLEDLRDEAVRKRLVAIWSEPMSLDPSKHAARVTRGIAERLAEVSKALEAAGEPPERVAMFLMRVLFTMFAEDVGLLPTDSFKVLLRECEAQPDVFPAMLEDLWQAMDEGRFTATIKHKVRRFNGEFFKDRTALPLDKGSIGKLREAAEHDWRDVEPAIFGTLLEEALDPDDRRRLGAHYTPRAYVERLVVATIIDPLRAEWEQVLSTAERQKTDGRGAEAVRTVQTFHDKLCDTRVLDPACGTGNFLYVSLELMKRLEGEVLEALADLGGQEALTGLEGHTVDPHQYLGLELNPRAAAIAELVLWIGHLQWYVRTRGGLPSDPILKAFRNIQAKDAALTWDGYPARKVIEGHEVFPNPRLPEWPKAEFIVGNPPFIGGKDIRARLGDGYAEALWAAHPHVNESADFVMYWWDRAADILLRRGTELKRFGFVTTNSISQVFLRRVMERHMSAKRPLSIVMATPDHPWRGALNHRAAVRIAMTVAEAGKRDGVLREVISEEGVDTDAPMIQFVDRAGKINPDLTVGVDVTTAVPLLANEGISSPGVKLHGAGFIVTPEDAARLGLGSIGGLEKHIRDYRNGRDLTARPRGVMVIDLDGLGIDDVRRKYPAVYQHVLLNVKPERDSNNEEYRRLNWWLFGRKNTLMRGFTRGIPRYIATGETAKHRVFQFLDQSILPDNMLIAIGSDDALLLGVLSSSIHVFWSLRAGGWLGVGNDPRYSKSRCFDPFPFPDCTDAQKAAIRSIAEELDAHRKRVLAAHAYLTLTGLYNVLERLRAGAVPEALDATERRTFDDGLVLVLKELHDRLDAAVAAAYGWPADLPEEEVLARLVALNKVRAMEEKRGLVRWLRPEYQIPLFGSEQEKSRQIEADLEEAPEARATGPRPAFPKGEMEQTAVVMAALAAAPGAVDAATIAAGFRANAKTRGAVAAILTALFRIGVIATADGGKTFGLRRAA
ncbi:class I SAM-dependent DNA methyltransferase [Xanthobacter tagetidis]|uniref:site-specific DNA-methyltransferase (adenine-specific) n=1 Tax=Xanthobacter tagetidis TaxID=60216 RepID=A0A3L7ADP3_9HYPH|nr:DNA methyltransferase [Xanthobacter tagetidis]MBB6306003.1 SAM-dependent methyltransferase [Xanthobacter tagetidis]RLP78513.1 class I SAM-dependent DNA methyltransferase [Xanthobacter tagetidis]